MQKFILILLSYFLLPHIAEAQMAPIKGIVSDTTNNTKIAYASIAVLRQEDSILVTHTRTGEDGKFETKPIDSGKYILLITYPNYGNFVEKIALATNEPPTFKNIFLTPREKLLEEIVLRQAAMRVKGDTTEYIADSFAVKPNASVEELLKQLPGIQVDRDGKITAQGEQVQKVLVDGDEFFSDDPTIATKNLRADAIDKVQVFDKKSDQATFTGIDDGNVTKTINLKLKENAKHGYFGKISAGGLDKYYNASAMINAFKAKRKFSAFAVASSTDQTGLNFSDSRSLGFSNRNVRMDGGVMYVTGSSNGGGLGAGNFNGQGLPESIKGGVHFSDKWKNDKYETGGSYIFNKLAQRAAGNTFSQNTLFDSVYYNLNENASHSDRMQHSLNAEMEIQIDSSSSIKINADGLTGTSSSNNSSTSQALSQEKKQVNSSDRKTSNTGNNQELNTQAIWRKKFKKKGRTVSISFDLKYNQSGNDGFLLNNSNFYDSSGAIIKTEKTDQLKKNTTESNVIGSRISYTEPLSKKSFIEVNYSFYNNSSNQKKLSFDKDGSGKYSLLSDSLSSDFKYVYQTNSAGINYRFNEKKFNFSFGGNISNTAFQQIDHFKSTTRKFNYYNLFPQGNFTYKFSSFSNINIRYNGSTTQPTIDQLQPLTDNSDPLNVVIGNPFLKQQFSNRFNMNYSSFEMLNERFIFLGASYSFTGNQISNSYTIDSLGKRISQYINVDGNYSAGIYGGINMKIPKTSFKVGFHPGFNISKNTNFVNGIKNISRNFTISPSIEVSTRKNEAYEVELTISPSYTNSTSSISKAAATNYWTYNYSLDGDYMLPGKIELGTNITFEHRQKINNLDQNNQVVLWNAYLEKRFLKKEQLSLRVSINDILDQNKGYSRNVQPNAIVERNYLTLRRYGLVTLTYNFNTSGARPARSGRSITF